MFRLLLLLSLCLPVAAVAGDAAPAGVPMPEAGARYGDRDPAAMAMHPRPGSRASFRRSLNAAIRKDPNNSVALLHRAYLFHAGGDLEEGDRDFQRVLRITEAETDTVNRRRALWSLGWSAYNRGEPGQAVAYWQQASETFRGRASWYPYTLAVGLWAMDEREAALAWYDAAARSQTDWTRREGVQARTLHWRDPEQRAAIALFEAWSAARPGAAP